MKCVLNKYALIKHEHDYVAVNWRKDDNKTDC